MITSRQELALLKRNRLKRNAETARRLVMGELEEYATARYWQEGFVPTVEQKARVSILKGIGNEGFEALAEAYEDKRKTLVTLEPSAELWAGVIDEYVDGRKEALA